jgi:hypothetical protein
MKTDLNMNSNVFQMNPSTSSFSLGSGEFKPSAQSFVPSTQNTYNQFPPQNNFPMQPMPMQNQGFGNQFGNMPPPLPPNQFMNNMGMNPNTFPNSSFGGYNNYGMNRPGFNPNQNAQPFNNRQHMGAN